LQIENLNLKEEMEIILLKAEINRVDKNGVKQVNNKNSKLKDTMTLKDKERPGVIIP